MADEKLTAKKVLAIVVLTTLAVLVYLGILIFSLPFTGNMMTSWILSLSFAAAVMLLCIASMLKTRWKRGT